MLTASLLLSAAILCPQGDGAPQDPLEVTLKKSTLSKLQKRLADFLEAQQEYGKLNLQDTRNRTRQREKMSKARDAFRSEWDKAAEDTEILGSMGDLMAMFQTAYPFEKVRGRGNFSMERFDDSTDFGVYVPKAYDHEVASPLVIAFPGYVDGKWVSPEDHFDATWEDAAMAENAIVMVPEIPEGIELDPVPDFSSPAEQQAEIQRLRTTIPPIVALKETYRWDPDRVFLDCGKGSSAFGLRFATYGPKDYAGIILRDPKSIGSMRLGSLMGCKVLLIETDANKEDVARIKAKMDQTAPGNCTVMAAKGEYPYPDMKADIAAWCGEVVRNPFPQRVVVEPNYDLFKDSYWAYIDVAEPIQAMPEDKRPRLEVTADRANNRIVVKAVSVDSFSLLLNDALVDLSQEFVVEINGVATSHTYQRSLNDMLKWSAECPPAGNPSFLFTAKFVSRVPKSTDEGEDTGGD